ncbi:MAG: hypothetical protein H6861_00185 [Rhodospirillales bacterium]|nr:hypothetical protein [Rhodospirillales bacterium]
MKNWTGIFTVLACLILCMRTQAGELDTYQGSEIPPERSISFHEDHKKLIMPFAGSDEEEGMLELFVTNAKVEHDNSANSSLADDLNRISPSAGVQFRLEF